MIVMEASTDNILKFKVSAKLEESDFARIAPQVEEMIKSHGSIRLLIDATAFDGWSDMQAAKKHFIFVRNHQAKIARIALIAGHMWQHWVAGVAGVFVHPDIKIFDIGQLTEAETWLHQD
jgi:hypothetical protein